MVIPLAVPLAIMAAKGVVKMAIRTKIKKGVRRAVLRAGKGLKLPFGGGVKAPKKRKSRSLFIRKGRLFMGFSQKEIKDAMRRKFGGRRRVKV